MKFKISVFLLLLFGFQVAAHAALTAEKNGVINSSIVFSGSPKFNDVQKTDWFYDDVMYAYNHSVMTGTDDNSFSPLSGITRAMMITIIHRTAGEPASDGIIFSDVGNESYCKNAVTWGAAEGIVSGTGDNTFSPDDPITREQLAVMLYNYGKTIDKAGNMADISSYSDCQDVSQWAKDAMCWAVGNGIISGTGDNELAPSRGATRAEAAAIIRRFFE